MIILIICPIVIFDLDLLFPDHFAGGTRDYMLMAQNVVEGGWLEPSELPDIMIDNQLKLPELPDIMTDNQLKLLIKTNDTTPEQLQNFGSNQYPCSFLDMDFLNPRQQVLLQTNGW
jgi:hypothetical protein